MSIVARKKSVRIVRLPPRQRRTMCGFFQALSLLLCLFPWLTLSACSASTSALPEKTPALQPCWIDKPVAENYAGQIGVAQGINSIGRESPLKSRQKALQAASRALGYHGELPQLDADQDSTSVGGDTIVFTDYISHSGLSYSLASWRGKPENTTQCQVAICELARCNPAWLCQASSASGNASLGLSYRTALPSAQYQRAVDNGLLQARMIHGSSVSSELVLSTSANDQFSQQIMYSDSSTRHLSERGFSNYAVTDSCMLDDTLALRVELLDIAPNSRVIESSEWIRQPKLNGRDGAVGTVERPTVSGLFSDQLKLAVERALVQLARENQVDISEESLYIQSEGGTLVLTTTRQSSQAILRAQVLAFHFQAINNRHLMVYAWVERLADYVSKE